MTFLCDCGYWTTNLLNKIFPEIRSSLQNICGLVQPAPKVYNSCNLSNHHVHSFKDNYHFSQFPSEHLGYIVHGLWFSCINIYSVNYINWDPALVNRKCLTGIDTLIPPFSLFPSTSGQEMKNSRKFWSKVQKISDFCLKWACLAFKWMTQWTPWYFTSGHNLSSFKTKFQNQSYNL